MNKLKAGAALLAASMLAGIFSGCSKTAALTTEAFAKACDKAGLEEIDFRESFGTNVEELEDGYYFVADEDDIEESAELFDSMLSNYGISEVIESDNIVSCGFAAKCSGVDGLGSYDADSLKDIEIDGAFALQMTLDKDDYAEDFMELIGDKLDSYDIDIKDLTAKEYYSSAKEGYIRLHIDLAKMGALAMDDDDFMDLLKMALGTKARKFFKSMEGDLVLSFEIKGENIFVIAGIAFNSDSTVYKDFAKAFGLKNDPMKLPLNEEFAKGIIEAAAAALDEQINSWINGGDDPVDPVDPTDPTDIDLPDTSDPGTEETKTKVGISLPTKELQRWNQDGDLMKKKLQEAGYDVELEYASNSTSTQAQQISGMIDSGCKVIIVAAIDPVSLNKVLNDAKNSGITIIAYDRQIMDTTSVDYYVTFDAYVTGTLQAKYIVYSLQLDAAEGPFNIEITSGDEGDPIGEMFYKGAMDVLQPYIDSGKLVVQSGQTTLQDTSTESWSTDRAQGRAENIIGTYYLDGEQIDAWLCLNDSTALGVATALETVYTGNYPIVTGQDCNIENVKNIINGKQSMSVFKDTRTLVEQTVKMTTQVLEGQPVDVNDTSTFNNGAKIVPSYLCTAIVVTIDNYMTILVDSGYYRADQLG